MTARDDHPRGGPALARRRGAVAVTTVAGAGLLGLSMAARPGSRAFYALSLGTAATWTLGALASEPVRRGWTRRLEASPRPPVLAPLATGAAAYGGFHLAARVVRRNAFLDHALTRALRFADRGDTRVVILSTLANGVAEEAFFRGALYAAFPPRYAVAGSTAVYTLVTATTRNPALVIAAAVMGSLFAAQRRATGGLQAPVLTHLAWSGLMVRYLPRSRPTVPDAVSVTRA